MAPKCLIASVYAVMHAAGKKNIRIFYPSSLHGKLSLCSCAHSNPIQGIMGEGSCLVSQEKKRTNDYVVGGNVSC